jgi:predicted nuclease of predicted toxin-antitoxin system
LKFLIDNALPPRFATLLRASGHDAVHVRDCGLAHASDEVIFARAGEEDRILVSADSDFAAILALRSAHRPSFILFREPDLTRAESYFDRLVATLATLEPDLHRGCVAVFRSGRIRVRTLPFSDQ